MITRRTFLAAGVAAALTVNIQAAFAGQPIVEIIALPHWPIQAALKPVREILKSYGDKIKVVEFNADEADGKARMKAVGKKGHVPVLILINGMYKYTRADGKMVEFENFPSDSNSPMGLNGKWSPSDVKAALDGMLK